MTGFVNYNEMHLTNSTEIHVQYLELKSTTKNTTVIP